MSSHDMASESASAASTETDEVDALNTLLVRVNVSEQSVQVSREVELGKGKEGKRRGHAPRMIHSSIIARDTCQGTASFRLHKHRLSRGSTVVAAIMTIQRQNAERLT